MKTKRTLFSIVVSFSVFWLSMILDFNINAYENNIKHQEKNTHIQADNSSLEESDNHDLMDYNYHYGAVATINEKLYSYRINHTDKQTDQDTNDTTTTEDDALSMDEEDSISKTDTTDIIDTTDTENTEPNENQDEEISIYSNIGISIAGSFVNIREEATTDSKIMGKLYKDSAAIILDNVGDWYYIESGSVKGYVKSDYLKTGIPDDELINNYGSHRISVNASGLNVRKEPDSESKKITVVYQNERYPVVEVLDEWVKIDISDDNLVGYVSKEHVELLVDFEKAISKKEEEELLKLQKEEEEKLRKKQAEEKAKKETEIKQRDETDYTEEELKLLACLVHSEAGDQSYEGKLAVANVVLNRMKSKKFPNTMKDVIYQPGQFSVAKNGSLKKQLSNYENYSSKSHKLTIKAAKAALSGENNIGDRLYFHAYKMAVKKGYNKKKNSVKLEDHLFW